MTKTRRQGFTLIELMVSVSIFAIVTLITSGAFIILADIYRKTQTNRAVMDNLNLAMDTMTLQIREGKNYSFECSEEDDCINFDEYIIDEEGNFRLNRELEYFVEDQQFFH